MRSSFLWLLFVPAALQAQQAICVRHLVVPGYPGLARWTQLQGSISVAVEISSNGKVLAAKAAGGHPPLMRATEDNVRQWTFGPFPKGRKFPVKHKIVYTYKLEGKPAYNDAVLTVVFDLPDQVQITTNPPQVQDVLFNRGPLAQP